MMRTTTTHRDILRGWEFTIFGNIVMSLMAIGGVCCMVYAVGTSMTNTNPADWGQLEEKARDDSKEAA